MVLLSQITITRENADASIQLLLGDLTAIPKEHAADILVISAYPNDYSTVDKQTLMSALYNNGYFISKFRRAVSFFQNSFWLFRLHGVIR